MQQETLNTFGVSWFPLCCIQRFLSLSFLLWNNLGSNSYTKRRRQWHPTPTLLPRKSHGRRSLVGCSPWDHEESDTTEQLHFQFSLSCFGEGNGKPLQCSCLENPRDGGAWWAAVYGVAQSQIRLKWLSSSSSSSSYTKLRLSKWKVELHPLGVKSQILRSWGWNVISIHRLHSQILDSPSQVFFFFFFWWGEIKLEVLGGAFDFPGSHRFKSGYQERYWIRLSRFLPLNLLGSL